ncbi:pectinesterase [Amborella trichopoda]|uniref:pectinesterase n=1 Tax=Amborella trichopoda TaxID=13333 RepID=UPI0005D377C5|nr:pectinesterase [Amborella trichopoda]|eukprot:XP_006828582.2 pectinesterase [Amborella trichopoda]
MHRHAHFSWSILSLPLMGSTLVSNLPLRIALLSTIFSLLIYQVQAASLSNLSHPQFESLCKSTPFPSRCFDTLKLSISIILPNILDLAKQTLENALSEATKTTNLLLGMRQYGLAERQKGTIQDCQELHQKTLEFLQKSLQTSNPKPQNLHKIRTLLSAALTNKNTCLEGLDSASGSIKPTLLTKINSMYELVSNSLSMYSNSSRNRGLQNRRLLAISSGQKSGFPARSSKKRCFPAWFSSKDRRILQSSPSDGYDSSDIFTVAKDGSGNYSSIMEAVNATPNNGLDRVVIYVKEGVYEENVVIGSHKQNLVMIGDGINLTVITGSRSVGDGWTTYRSATLAVAGDGFLARDITFENTAGPEKHQAVALRVNADVSAFYRCSFRGYQDTLYVHSLRQFYRECDIYGTVDFIFGNAATVFQACNIFLRKPMKGQFNVITAQSRDDPNENTGISIQNCTIEADTDYEGSQGSTKNYLGRPWRIYSQTVYMESYIGGLIDLAGWTNWSGNRGIDTLYYGEYNNDGPGSATDNRVSWPGYHVMDYSDAKDFTVSEFIDGNEWLDSTSFPYDDGV